MPHFEVGTQAVRQPKPLESACQYTTNSVRTEHRSPANSLGRRASWIAPRCQSRDRCRWHRGAVQRSSMLVGPASKPSHSTRLPPVHRESLGPRSCPARRIHHSEMPHGARADRRASSQRLRSSLPTTTGSPSLLAFQCSGDGSVRSTGVRSTQVWYRPKGARSSKQGLISRSDQ
jgi:hypothetical protein